jgi:hypothetical protein
VCIECLADLFLMRLLMLCISIHVFLNRYVILHVTFILLSLFEFRLFWSQSVVRIAKINVRLELGVWMSIQSETRSSRNITNVRFLAVCGEYFSRC